MVWVTSPERARAFVLSNEIDVLITDVTFEGGAAGRLLSWVAEQEPSLPCLIVTRRPDLARRSLLPKNVQRVLLKPIDEDVLIGCLERALRAKNVSVAPPRSEPAPTSRSAVACSARLGNALRFSAR